MTKVEKIEKIKHLQNVCPRERKTIKCPCCKIKTKLENFENIPLLKSKKFESVIICNRCYKIYLEMRKK